MFSNRSESDPVEYAETPVEFTSIPIPAQTVKQPLVQPVEPPVSADLHYLNALLQRRYDMNIRDAGIMVTNQKMLTNLIKDITAAMLSDSAMQLDTSMRRSHAILNSARTELNRINATLHYADILNDMPQTWWERFELTRAFNIIPYILIGLNTVLSFAAIILSTMLCTKLWSLLP